MSRAVRHLPQCMRRAGSWIGLVSVLLSGAIGCGDGGSGGLSTRVDSEVVAERVAASGGLPIEEAYRAALSEEDPLVRHMLLTEVYGRVDAENFDAIRQVFQEDLGRRRPDEARVIGSLWAKVDPDYALSDVMSWMNASVRRFASREIMSVLIQRENAAAARAALDRIRGDLPEGVALMSDQALAEAMGRHLALEPLLDYLSATENDEVRRRMLAAALIEITRAERDAFIRWAEQVHAREGVDPKVREEIVLQAVRLLATTREIDEAIAFYPTIADGPYSGSALSIMAEQWARKDPQATFAYLAERPDSEEPELARRAAAFIWLQADGLVAKPELLRRVEEEPGMSSVIFPLVQYLMVSDPPTAMELAKHVPDPAERAIVLKQGLVRWVRLDAPAVDQYLASYQVPSEVLEAVQLARNLKTSQAPKPEGLQ